MAAKFSLGTMSKVYTKFGPLMEYKHTDKKGNVKTYSFYRPSYKLTFKFLINSTPVVQTLFGNRSLANLDGLECSVCNSDTDVEMHHVRFLKDLNPKLDMIDKLMATKKRKQIPLCRSCHLEKHTRAKRVERGFPMQQIRKYHHKSLKRKGRALVVYKEKQLSLIPHSFEIENIRRMGISKTFLLLGLGMILMFISLVFSEPDDLTLYEFIPEKEEKISSTGPIKRGEWTEKPDRHLWEDGNIEIEDHNYLSSEQ